MTHNTKSNVVLYHRTAQGEYVVGTRLFYGERCALKPIDDTFLECTLKTDGYTGFIKRSDYESAGLREAHTNLTCYIVKNLATFLYTQPSIKHPDAIYIPRGSRIYVDHHAPQNITFENEKSDFWQTDEGAYVWKAHLAPFTMPAHDATQSLTQQHINQAMTYAADMLGLPYLWGGRTTSGCDCSGLVQTAYLLTGCILPRDSWMQEQMASLDPAQHANIPKTQPPKSRSFAIDSEPLERGDLIFWKGHVGMMEDAHMLLHASGHHMCVVREPLALARARIVEKTGADVSSVRRFLV